MVPLTPPRLIVLFAVLVVVLSTTSAQYVCMDTTNRNDAPLCNGTELQSTLPTKACNWGYEVNLAYSCTAENYNYWVQSCPKRRRDVAGFCGARQDNYYYNPCFVNPCTTDADCALLINSPYQLPCYECCQTCFEEEVCHFYVNNGWFAPIGSTNCTACPTEPKCENGYKESTNFCNCYSGFTSDPSLPTRLCSAPPQPSCLPLNNASPMENTVFPSIANLQAQRNTLRLSVNSSFVSGRRTLIEFPNATCNMINSPNFFNKTTSGCKDVHNLEIPFAECGFVKTTETDHDIFRGVMHVKHIDTIVVDGESVDRIVDTPFTIAIRLPNNLAVQTSVEIATPVGTALKAVFVGQTVDASTQTGQLTFLTSAPAALTVFSGRIASTPSTVSAALRFIDQNCRENSTVGFCQQRLALDLSITNCDISGLYALQVQVGCTNPQNCPIGLEGTVNVTLLASITAQRTCGEAFVDVGLSGSLQAFSDQSFTNQKLSFNFGKRSYFLVNTVAERDVVISGVTLDSVYYSGPNVPGSFLLTNNGTVSSAAALSNFTWGQHSDSQAWFAFDVTVSRPDSNQNTLFKLNNDESGVYNLMAMVSVEWLENGASVKKRMVLEGKSSFSQGSQFTAQVQISNTNQDDKAEVSGSVGVTVPVIAVLASIAFTWLF